MNDYLFAFVCMLGVMAILGFFSLVIYASGIILSSSKGKDKGKEKGETEKGEIERGEEKKEAAVSEAGSRGAIGDSADEELKKVAAIAAVIAMAESGAQVKAKTPVSESRKNRGIRARYPSPWALVRE
jgi:hypothetical protein